jgi:hypothetical protein
LREHGFRHPCDLGRDERQIPMVTAKDKMVRMLDRSPSLLPILLPMTLSCAAAGCRDVSRFTTSGDHYEGLVVQGDFVRAGVEAGTRSCVTIDADHLQDSPGSISTSDGRFQAVALRPIPQVWHDPLSTLSFGEGRVRNLVYVATATVHFDDGNGDDALVVVSLMQSGSVEVRLIRGAPPLPSDGAAAVSSGGNLFAVFDLARTPGQCSF